MRIANGHPFPASAGSLLQEGLRSAGEQVIRTAELVGDHVEGGLQPARQGIGDGHGRVNRVGFPDQTLAIRLYAVVGAPAVLSQHLEGVGRPAACGLGNGPVKILDAIEPDRLAADPYGLDSHGLVESDGPGAELRVYDYVEP